MLKLTNWCIKFKYIKLEQSLFKQNQQYITFKHFYTSDFKTTKLNLYFAVKYVFNMLLDSLFVERYIALLTKTLIDTHFS